jgi:hypothetical protein
MYIKNRESKISKIINNFAVYIIFMKNLNLLFLLFLIVVFCIGLYLYSFGLLKKNAILSQENMEDKTDDKKPPCPDMLINRGDVLLLYDSNSPELNGVNPIPFYNLDEYINYLEIQRKKGIHCPILYLQKENDTQGNDIYRMRPSPFDQQGGLQPYGLTKAELNHQDLPNGYSPKVLFGDDTSHVDTTKPIQIIDATREHPPYNAGNYAGFDPHGMDIGRYTDVDKIHDSTNQTGLSDNPHDSSWGGVLFTQQAIDSGKYDENNIRKPQYITPKGEQIPNLYPGIPPPDDRAY